MRSFALSFIYISSTVAFLVGAACTLNIRNMNYRSVILKRFLAVCVLCNTVRALRDVWILTNFNVMYSKETSRLASHLGHSN